MTRMMNLSIGFLTLLICHMRFREFVRISIADNFVTITKNNLVYLSVSFLSDVLKYKMNKKIINEEILKILEQLIAQSTDVKSKNCKKKKKSAKKIFKKKKEDTSKKK